MAIGTAGIFTSMVFIVILAGILMGSSYGAGLNQEDTNSPQYKASVAFAGISSLTLIIFIMVVFIKAISSNDTGVKGYGKSLSPNL